jgi:hypothetical protein
MSTHVLEELRNLFEWNPRIPPYAVRRVDPWPKEYDLRNIRQATFYDMHLASAKTCKRVVHVPYLHEKIAHIVDAKMQQIREGNITLQSPSTGDFTNTANREEKVNRKSSPLTEKRSVVNYYSIVISECCLPIASSLALHPKFWLSVITWSGQPRCSALGSYGPSLQIIQMDEGKAYFGPEVMDAEVLEKLVEMEARPEDLATWEVTSLSIKDTEAMFGVLTMAVMSNDGEFRWTTGSGTPCVMEDGDLPKLPSLKTAADSPETLALIESPRAIAELETNSLDSPENILDASLRRGGSSLEAVREDMTDKEAVIVSFFEKVGSDSETESEAMFKSDLEDQVPWTLPGADYAASHELVQRVRKQSDICIPGAWSNLKLFRIPGVGSISPPKHDTARITYRSVRIRLRSPPRHPNALHIGYTTCTILEGAWLRQGADWHLYQCP